MTDVEEALESYTATPLGNTMTAEQRKAALATDLAALSASAGKAKWAYKYNTTAKRILAPKRGRGLATLTGGCFSNVRAPVDFAEVADAMRVSPLTGESSFGFFECFFEFFHFFFKKKKKGKLTLFSSLLSFPSLSLSLSLSSIFRLSQATSSPSGDGRTPPRPRRPSSPPP